MDKTTREKLAQAAAYNPHIKSLYEKHRELDQQVTELNNRSFLSESEISTLKTLKFKKRKGKVDLLKLLDEHYAKTDDRESLHFA